MDIAKVYVYDRCSTCRKAIKYLNAKGVSYETIAIVENPPSKAELQKALADSGGELRKLFNTSGQVYREMQLSKKIKTMDLEEGIDLLSAHGKLVKRPFVVTEKGTLIGFKEEVWDQFFVG